MFDFSAATRRALARKGIEVYGTTFVPAADGSFANGDRAYKVSDNGCGRIWTFRQVLEAAQ
jgi:hypothetical protein